MTLNLERCTFIKNLENIHYFPPKTEKYIYMKGEWFAFVEVTVNNVDIKSSKPQSKLAGYLNKSAFEVWRSVVQMNSVNLAGQVLHTRGKNELWNLIFYPLLSLSLFSQHLLTLSILAEHYLPLRLSSLFLFLPTIQSSLFSHLTFHQFEWLGIVTTQATSQRGADFWKLGNHLSFLLYSPPSCRLEFTDFYRTEE